MKNNYFLFVARSRFGAITKKRWFTWNLKPSDASSAKQSRSPHESGEAPQDDGSIFRCRCSFLNLHVCNIIT